MPRCADQSQGDPEGADAHAMSAATTEQVTVPGEGTRSAMPQHADQSQGDPEGADAHAMSAVTTDQFAVPGEGTRSEMPQRADQSQGDPVGADASWCDPTGDDARPAPTIASSGRWSPHLCACRGDGVRGSGHARGGRLGWPCGPAFVQGALALGGQCRPRVRLARVRPRSPVAPRAHCEGSARLQASWPEGGMQRS